MNLMVNQKALNVTQINESISYLKQGNLVVFPTDTLYGIAVDPANEQAVKRLIDIKGRSYDQGIPLLLGDTEDAKKYTTHFNIIAQRLANSFWPGPLTLVLPSAPSISALITGGRNTIALRVPDHPVARFLASEMGGAITGTSANKHGNENPVNVTEIRHQIGEYVDLILDGGVLSDPAASSIVEIGNDDIHILRQGVIPEERLQKIAFDSGFIDTQEASS